VGGLLLIVVAPHCCGSRCTAVGSVAATCLRSGNVIKRRSKLFAGSIFDLRWYNSAEVKTIDDISTASAAAASGAKVISPAIAVASRET
jgi:hypothetical protein